MPNRPRLAARALPSRSALLALPPAAAAASVGASIDDLQGLARESSEVAGRRGDAAFTVVADLHPIPRARDAVPIHHRR